MTENSLLVNYAEKRLLFGHVDALRVPQDHVDSGKYVCTIRFGT